MNTSKVNRWDVPVIRALDHIQRLPGFAPDHVAWDHFVFGADDLHGPMNTAAIYAFPVRPRTPEVRLIRFGFCITNTPRHRTGFTVTNISMPPLSTTDLVRAVDIPRRSAIQTKALLNYALQTSLEEYTIAHAARRRPAASTTFSASARTDARSLGAPACSAASDPTLSHLRPGIG